MRKILTSLLVGMAVLGTGSAVQARDTKLILPIRDALNFTGGKKPAREIIDPDIQLVFGEGAGESEGEGGDEIIRSGLVANKKTNGFNKSDEAACHWAFLSAVRQFQESAKKAGATKVVNLVSYYKKREFKSTTDYECHAGAFVVGVALKGDLAK